MSSMKQHSNISIHADLAYVGGSTKLNKGVWRYMYSNPFLFSAFLMESGGAKRSRLNTT